MLLASNGIEAYSVHITQPEVHTAGITREATKEKVIMFRLSQSSNCDQHKQKLLATILGNRWPHCCMQHDEICIMTTCTDKPQPFQKPAAVLSGI